MKEVDVQPLIDAASNYLYFKMVMQILEPFIVILILFIIGFGIFKFIKFIVRGS